jgi:hypothetical protein
MELRALSGLPVKCDFFLTTMMLFAQRPWGTWLESSPAPVSLWARRLTIPSVRALQKSEDHLGSNNARAHTNMEYVYTRSFLMYRSSDRVDRSLSHGLYPGVQIK